MLRNSRISMTRRVHSLEYTTIPNGKDVFHYTCNPPSYEILAKHGIKAIGHEFGCSDPREILLIPRKVYKKYGYLVRDFDIKIISENLLRKLELEEKKNSKKNLSKSTLS